MTRMDAKLLPSGGAECPVPGSPDRRPAVGLGRKLPKQKSKAMELGDVGAQRVHDCDDDVAPIFGV